MKPASTGSARLGLEKAIRRVESARAELDFAAQLLGQIRLCCDLYDTATALRESVAVLRHRCEVVARSGSGLSVDSEPEP